VTPAAGRARTLLLVHGAGSGPGVFAAWPEHFPGWRVETVDLHTGLDVAHATMVRYAAAIAAAAAPLARPLVLAGWSMGGLAAAMLAAGSADALVLLEASAPGEVQGYHREVVPAPGVFDPEREYGAFPAGMPARPESSLARAERKRGISVPALPGPTLVVYGEEFAEERGRRLAKQYGAREIHLPGRRHWDLVIERAAIAAVAREIARLI
jgi:pimeloyl-ACP methyl ester carboxylesterase